jgi:hypothetical protein
MLIAYDLTGRIIAVVNEHPATAGAHRTMLPNVAGVMCIQMHAQGRTANCLLVAHAR